MVISIQLIKDLNSKYIKNSNNCQNTIKDKQHNLKMGKIFEDTSPKKDI